MIQVVPETDSPITHQMSSNHKEGGIQATIFLKRQEPFFYHDILEDDDEERVYLTSSNIAEFFQPFFLTKDNALIMTLGVYLNILKFMKESWPEIFKAIQDKISLLKDHTYPLTLAKNVTFASDGHVVYERWFDECFFFYFESSKDGPGTKRFIHLQIQNKSIQLEPDVLFNMSYQLDPLLNILTRAGYKYPGPIVQHFQFKYAL